MLATGSAAVATAVLVSGCATPVTLPAGPEASDPLCGEVIAGVPEEVAGLERRRTTSQGTAAWGEGADVVALRCGVVPPGPTTELCQSVTDDTGREIDWIVTETDELLTYTTYGRTPAVDVTVPRGLLGDQPSAAVLDLAGVVDPLPQHAACL